MALVPSGTASALLEIFIFLAGAEALRYRLQRVGVPQIVGEVIFGMLLAPVAVGGLLNSLLGFGLFQVNEILIAFADFSVILLIFAAGLEGGVASLRKAGLSAILAAIVGNLVPFGATYLVFSRFYPTTEALLLGVAAGSTSTAVVVSLLRSEGVGGTQGGQFLLATGALDDVVGLVLLSAVLGVVGGRLSLISVTGSVAITVAVWVGVLLASVAVIPRVFRILGPRESYNLPFLILFVLAAIVTAVGFSTIAGAYIAGLAIAESVVASRTKQTSEILLAVFGSLFFVVVGFEFDVRLLLNPFVVVSGLSLALLAGGTQVLSILPFSLFRFRRRADALTIAFGMVPRGEIGLIVGVIGIAGGFLSQQALGAILLMSLTTIAVGSFLFRYEAGVARTQSVSPPLASTPSL